VGRTLDAFFIEIVDDWTRRGHDVRCAAGTPPDAPLPFDLVHGLSQRPTLGSVLVPSRIRSWVEVRELDVLVTNTATASTLARILPLPCKVVYFCHGLHWNTGRHPAQVVERALASRCDTIFSINSDDYEWLRRRHHDVRLLCHGVGVPDNRYQWSPVPQGERLELVWAGDFVPRKRPLDAVQVARQLAREGAKLRLVMLGDGELWNDTARAVKEIGLESVVELPGRRPVEPVLRGAHALLHTSAWEGLPRILLEGMVMGRRAFAYDVKGVRDVPHVLLAPDGDAAALASLVADHQPPPGIDAEDVADFRTSRVSAELIGHLEQIVG
jgi:glycosyltransferase involved in cell wall biosynthesis